MSRSVRGLPDPTPKAVQIFLKQLGRGQLHEQGWIEINKRFHGLSRAVRPFIQEHFKTPEEQEAAFDGLTLALTTMAHFDDVDRLQALLNTTIQPEGTNKLQVPEVEAAPQPQHEAEDHQA